MTTPITHRIRGAKFPSHRLNRPATIACDSCEWTGEAMPDPTNREDVWAGIQEAWSKHRLEAVRAGAHSHIARLSKAEAGQLGAAASGEFVVVARHSRKGSG